MSHNNNNTTSSNNFISSLACKKWFIHRIISQNVVHRYLSVWWCVCVITFTNYLRCSKKRKKYEWGACVCVCVLCCDEDWTRHKSKCQEMQKGKQQTINEYFHKTLITSYAFLSIWFGWLHYMYKTLSLTHILYIFPCFCCCCCCTLCYFVLPYIFVIYHTIRYIHINLIFFHSIQCSRKKKLPWGSNNECACVCVVSGI